MATPRPNLSEWLRELVLIGAHAALAEGGNPDLFSKSPAETIKAAGLPEEFAEQEQGGKPLLLRRLDLQTAPIIFDVARPSSKTRNYETVLVDKNLAGWLWLLVGRDSVLGITYKPCPECGVREVPSLTPNGKPALRCTDNCNLIASRKVQAAGKAKIGITATGTATIKKGKKNA